MPLHLFSFFARLTCKMETCKNLNGGHTTASSLLTSRLPTSVTILYPISDTKCIVWKQRDDKSLKRKTRQDFIVFRRRCFRRIQPLAHSLVAIHLVQLRQHKILDVDARPGRDLDDVVQMHRFRVARLRLAQPETVTRQLWMDAVAFVVERRTR